MKGRIIHRTIDGFKYRVVARSKRVGYHEVKIQAVKHNQPVFQQELRTVSAQEACEMAVFVYRTRNAGNRLKV